MFALSLPACTFPPREGSEPPRLGPIMSTAPMGMALLKLSPDALSSFLPRCNHAKYTPQVRNSPPHSLPWSAATIVAHKELLQFHFNDSVGCIPAAFSV